MIHYYYHVRVNDFLLYEYIINYIIVPSRREY